MIKEHPIFKNIGEIAPTKWKKSALRSIPDNKKFSYYYQNFYKTNPIARASLIMNDVSKMNENNNNLRAAE